MPNLQNIDNNTNHQNEQNTQTGTVVENNEEDTTEEDTTEEENKEEELEQEVTMKYVVGYSKEEAIRELNDLELNITYEEEFSENLNKAPSQLWHIRPHKIWPLLATPIKSHGILSYQAWF